MQESDIKKPKYKCWDVFERKSDDVLLQYMIIKVAMTYGNISYHIWWSMISEDRIEEIYWLKIN